MRHGACEASACLTYLWSIVLLVWSGTSDNIAVSNTWIIWHKSDRTLSSARGAIISLGRTSVDLNSSVLGTCAITRHTTSQYRKDYCDAQPDGTRATSGKDIIPDKTSTCCVTQWGWREVPDPQELGSCPPHPEAPPSPSMDVPRIHPADWQAGSPLSQPLPKPQHSEGPHQGRQALPVGGIMYMSRGGRNSYQGVTGTSSWKEGPARSVHRTDMLVPPRVHSVANPCPDQNGEGQG